MMSNDLKRVANLWGVGLLFVKRVNREENCSQYCALSCCLSNSALNDTTYWSSPHILWDVCYPLLYGCIEMCGKVN